MKKAKTNPFLFNEGDSFDYHGRTGIICSVEDDAIIVYFSDVDAEEVIDIDEAIEQNF